MLRRNVVRCCVVVVRSEPPPTVGQGGRSPGGRPGPGKIWEVEVEGGDTAAIHFDPHYLAWEGGGLH